MKIEVTYANEGQATIDLDPSTFRKVTIDPERAYDTRVRVAFKDGQEPLDLFFLKEGAPEPSPLGPFVTYVTVFRPGSNPVVLTDPVAIYDTLSNLFLYGERGTKGTKDPGGNMEPGESVRKERLRKHFLKF